MSVIDNITSRSVLLEVLASVGDAFLPALDPETVPRTDYVPPTVHNTFCATSFGALAGCLEWAYDRLTALATGARRKLILLLYLLSTRLGSLLLCGPTVLSMHFPFVRTFSELTVEERQGVLVEWTRSWIPHLRQAHRGLRSLTMLAVATWTDGQGHSPVWDAMGFPGPDAYKPKVVHPAAREADDLMQDNVVHLPSLRHTSQSEGTTDGHFTARQLKEALEAAGLKQVDCVPALDAQAARAGARNGHRGGMDVCVVRCDAVVVGSGAGGGVAAALLAQAGMQVVVLEKGDWLPTREMDREERRSLSLLFEDGALTNSGSMGVSVLAGSGLGGGTRLNWCASFRTPAHVREEWAMDFGLTDINGPAYEAALDAVCTRLVVHDDVVHDGQAIVLRRGLEALDCHAGTIPRNCLLAEGCQGLCTLGCASGHKQDAVTTWLADAARTGRVRILTGVHAERVLMQDSSADSGTTGAGGHQRKKTAKGVLVTCKAADGVAIAFEVRAEYIISSGGSLHTPALLLRSGISCKGNVGNHLRLHPATVVAGVFPPNTPLKPGCFAGPVKMMDGAMMSAYSNCLARWDGSGYGALLSVPQMTVGLFSALLPWEGASRYREALMNWPYTSNVLSYTRDQGGGRIAIDSQGHPIVHYWPAEETLSHIMDAVVLSIRVLACAGAHTIMTHHLDAKEKRCELKGPDDPALQLYICNVREDGIHENHLPLYSAHQMGSCRMGTDPDKSAVDAAGECWEVANLYVADASTFPTASGVNPMITAQAMSYYIISKLVARWMTERKQGVGGVGQQPRLDKTPLSNNAASQHGLHRRNVQIEYERT